MVQKEFAFVKFYCNAATAVSSFVFVVDGRNLRLYLHLFQIDIFSSTQIFMQMPYQGYSCNKYGQKISKKSARKNKTRADAKHRLLPECLSVRV